MRRKLLTAVAAALLVAAPLTVVSATADAGTAAAATRYRTVTDFDAGWLFNYGDASGASGASYNDASWRKLSKNLRTAVGVLPVSRISSS